MLVQNESNNRNCNINRAIQDNISIADEVFHSLTTASISKKVNIVIKLDMQKAYKKGRMVFFLKKSFLGWVFVMILFTSLCNIFVLSIILSLLIGPLQAFLPLSRS